MRKLLHILLLSLFCSFCCSEIHAAENTGGKSVSIAVLPFQVNAPEPDQLRTSIPALFVQQLSNQGFRVIPYAEVQRLVKSRNISDLNLSVARTLASALRADYAVYGSYTQTGDSFSIDTRMTDAHGAIPARPFFTEKHHLLELHNAVDELVMAMSGTAVGKNAIADVQIRGLKVLDQDVVLMRLATRRGDTVNDATINDEIKRIWNLGYFSDVSADIEESGSGRILVFTVVEKPRIDDVVINGSDAVKKDDILAAMSSKTGSVINDRLLAEDIQKITELYRKEGYYLAEVNYTIESQAKGASAKLVFNVKEGNKLYIKEVRIEGAETIDVDDMKKQLALSKRTLISWITGTGVLREEYLDRDSLALTAYAMNHGYVDAQVSAPQVDYEEDGIFVTFTIQEGKRYKLGEVGFRGELIDSDEKLAQITKLDDLQAKDDYFSLSVAQDDIKALTDYYGNFGYAFAEVNMDLRKNAEDNTVSVFFVIQKKQKVRVRRVVVQGNTRTRDNVILRELRLADGDGFSGEKLRRSNERLTRLRYFTQADTTILPTEKEDEVDLRVNIKEDRTGALMAGVGYSTYYQFGVSGNIMERNLFGRGYQLGLTGFLSGRSTSLNLNFVNPRIFDTYFGLNENAYAMWDEWDDFEKKTVGNTFRFFHPLGEYSSIFVGYRLDRYTLYNIPDRAIRAYKEYEGRNISSVLSTGFTYDSTNNRERPTKGFAGYVAVEYGGGGIGGNDNFFKPTAELQGFHTLAGNPNHVFHWRGKASAAFENSSKTVPVFDRFFIGGINSIRGYKSEDLAPKDPKWKDDEIGGDRMGFLNLEYIWTFQDTLGLAVVPFFDIGFNIDSKQTSDPFTELKKSVGLELRWRSPMGDLRFAYGYPLDKNVEGKHPGGRFEFTMGQFF